MLLAKSIPFEVVNINLKKKPEWFLAETWGQVSVVRCGMGIGVCKDEIRSNIYIIQIQGEVHHGVSHQQ